MTNNAASCRAAKRNSAGDRAAAIHIASTAEVRSPSAWRQAMTTSPVCSMNAAANRITADETSAAAPRGESANATIHSLLIDRLPVKPTNVVSQKPASDDNSPAATSLKQTS